jgi:hypothetical protein
MRQGLQTGLGGTRGKSQCHTISDVYVFMHGAPLFVWSGWGLARIKRPNSSLLTVRARLAVNGDFEKWALHGNHLAAVLGKVWLGTR